LFPYIITHCLNFSGVLTGCGEQKIGGSVHVLTSVRSTWPVGIPMAILLAFVTHLNGMVSTEVLQNLLRILTMLLFSNDTGAATSAAWGNAFEIKG
jgi:Na+-driven multidrug efflux pump